MDSTERVKLRQFCSLPVSIAAIFCAIPSKVCVAALYYLRHTVRGALFPLAPAGPEACHPAPRSWSSAAQVFFCSDMTLFSARGLSPYCSFRRCSVASRSACRSVSPRLFASMAARFARCCCANLSACCASAFQALLIRNLVAKCSQLAFVAPASHLYAPAGISPVQTAGDVAPPPPVPRTALRLPQIRRCWLIFSFAHGMLLQASGVHA